MAVGYSRLLSQPNRRDIDDVRTVLDSNQLITMYESKRAAALSERLCATVEAIRTGNISTKRGQWLINEAALPHASAKQRKDRRNWIEKQKKAAERNLRRATNEEKKTRRLTSYERSDMKLRAQLFKMSEPACIMQCCSLRLRRAVAKSRVINTKKRRLESNFDVAALDVLSNVACESSTAPFTPSLHS